MWYHKDNTRGRQNKVPIGKEKNPRLRLVNASPFFDARGLCLCIQPVGHRVLAIAVGGAAGQGQRQGVFAGGQKPRQREFVRRPEGDARRLVVDSQLGHLLPGQGQQRRGGLQLRCCDLQCGAVGLGEMGRVLVRKGKVWCGQRQSGSSAETSGCAASGNSALSPSTAV